MNINTARVFVLDIKEAKNSIRARLTASLELMSGFGAPARTATPMPDLANTDNDARPALTARVGTKHPAPSLEWATGWKDYHKWLWCTSIVPRR